MLGETLGAQDFRNMTSTLQSNSLDSGEKRQRIRAQGSEFCLRMSPMKTFTDGYF